MFPDARGGDGCPSLCAICPQSGAWLSAHQKWNDLELDHCSGYLTEEQPKNIVLLSWGGDTATLQKENL